MKDLSERDQIEKELIQREITRRQSNNQSMNNQASQPQGMQWGGPVDFAQGIAQAGINAIPDTFNSISQSLGDPRQLYAGLENLPNTPNQNDPSQMAFGQPKDPRLTLPTADFAPHTVAGQVPQLLELLMGPGELKIAKKLLTDPKQIAKDIYALTPAGQRKKILNYLNPDNLTISENKRALADRLLASGENQKTIKQEMYDKALNPNTKSIALESTPAAPNQPYVQLSIPNHHASRDLVQSVKEFNKNPTFDNFHKMQSEMDGISRDLSESTNTFSEKQSGRLLREQRDQLVDHYIKKLEKINPEVANHYKAASENYKINYRPYLDHAPLRNLLEGNKGSKKTHMNALGNLFDNKNEGLETIADHIGKGLGKNLIFNKVGTKAASKGKIFKQSSGKFGDSMDKALNEQGLDKFADNELKDMHKNLEFKNKIARALSTLGIASGIGEGSEILKHIF